MNRLFRPSLVLLLLFMSAPNGYAQEFHSQLIPAGTDSDLPRVVANDNRSSGGMYVDGIFEIDLVIVEADFRIEESDGPGLRVMAIAEKGKAPTVPGPLIRVEEGTRVRARISNTMPDSSVTVFGFHKRPQVDAPGLELDPGEMQEFEFEAGSAGTYMYYLKKSVWLSFDDGENEQLAGAFIIDPPGGSPADQIFVINIFGTPEDRGEAQRIWAFTINGLSWPFTERITPSVGDTLRWRIINASGRLHPMHLHGFFYDVLSVGNISSDLTYEKEQRRTVVTESMFGQSTMLMEWIPRREGNWLFHCHLSFHVSSALRNPTAKVGDHDHMAGLVLGINVKPGVSDLISEGSPAHLTLHANEFMTDSLTSYKFSIDSNDVPESYRDGIPGPIIFMEKYQTTNVTLKNHMSIPTGVHWHGLELDSWADGVPNWSASDGKVSPVIEPGEEFTYKLSAMRSGTFIYHSHLDDIPQLAGGLYGPLIVMDKGAVFDPHSDHIYTVGWKTVDGLGLDEWDLNGTEEQPDMYVEAGESHRLRLLSIGPASASSLWMTKNGEPYPLTALAKDGADLPSSQQVEVDRGIFIGPGETVDYTFTPREPGEYVLGIGPDPNFSWFQKWIVSDGK